MVVGCHGGDVITGPPAILAPASCQPHASQMFHPGKHLSGARWQEVVADKKPSAGLGADLAPDPQEPSASAFDSFRY